MEKHVVQDMVIKSKDGGVKNIPHLGNVKPRRVSTLRTLEKNELVKWSLGCLNVDHPFREFCLRITRNKWFDRFILLLILANSLVLALTDYGCVDLVTGEPSTRCSWRNLMAEQTEAFFSICFIAECALKIISLGFIRGKNTYLRDPWNGLDFVVVLASIVGMLPKMPDVSALRTFRVLRPLRSLSALPGLRLLVVSLLSSISALVNVLVLLGVVFTIVGILGVQIWSGLFHFRCRLTPFPVKLQSIDSYPPSDEYILKVVQNPDEYRCLPVENDNSEWTLSTSPWSEPQPCFWPIEHEYTHVCSIGSSGRTCGSKHTCGSNFDKHGNPRFVDIMVNGTKAFNIESALDIPELNYGLTTFDHIGLAFVTIFQSITMEGWTTIMYMAQDSYSTMFAACLFCFLILFASFFLLNLTLAVIWEEFEKSSKKFELANSQSEAKKKENNEANSKYPTVAPGLGGFFMFKFVTHPKFTIVVVFLIVTNTIILSLDHHPMDDHFAQNVEYFNVTLSVAFTMEMICKILGLGIRLYARDPFNMFDAMIVTISLSELVLVPPVIMGGTAGESGAGALSALRTFRLFRVFKLARNWQALQVLLATIVRTLKDISNFAVLLLLFMYIYALIGMQFFANKLRFSPTTNRPLSFVDNGYENGTLPRAHFDDLLWAFTTVFQILTGENWNAVMYDCWRSTGAGAAIYFISLICLGDWITMNLFLAILLGNFENIEELASPAAVKRLSGSMRGSFRNLVEAVQTSNRNLRRGSNSTSQVVPVTDEMNAENTLERLSQNAGLTKMASFRKKPGSDRDLLTPTIDEVVPDQLVDDPPNKSLFLFGVHSEPRRTAIKVTEHAIFNNTILALICISSVLLAIDNPLYDPDSTIVQFLGVCNIFLTILFTGEMALKVIAMGLIQGKNAYLKNSWNILDGIIVGISIISLATTGNSSLKSLRSLRTLRALRPLRMISRRPGLKLVVNALFRSVPSIVNVLFVCLLFLLIFSVIGINYFKGTFSACQGELFDALDVDKVAFLTQPPTDWFPQYSTWMGDCHPDGTKLTSKMVCECWGLEWGSTVPQNFDNIGNAMGALFELSTTEGWVDVMYAGVDATGVDMQPIRDHSVGWVFFFILYMVVGSFFAMNLFVGVVIDNFNRMKEELGDNVLMTASQKLWIKTHQMAMKIRPSKVHERPDHPIRGICDDITRLKGFEFFIFACIISNSAGMALHRFGQSEEYEMVLVVLNLFCSIVFTVEAIMKVIAQQRQYFLDSWNKFDFAIVCGSNIGFVLSAMGLSLGAIATVVQLFRVGRIIRLINGIKSLRQMFNTLLLTLPSLGNIGSLLFLLFFIYSVMAVQLFALVGFNGAYDKHANFQGFWTSMVTLMTFSTGENWNGFMYDVAAGYNNGKNCSSSVEFQSNMCGFTDAEDCIPLNGCGSWTIYPFLYSFTLIVTFVMLNLFIAVILEGFSETNEDDIVLTSEQLHSFQIEWERIDPKATCFAPANCVIRFLFDTAQTFRLSERVLSKEYIEHELASKLPIYEGKFVHFKDCMEAMAHAAMVDTALKKGDLSDFSFHLDKGTWEAANKSSLDDLSLDTYLAVQTVQKSFLAYKSRSERRRIMEQKSVDNEANDFDFIDDEPSSSTTPYPPNDHVHKKYSDACSVRTEYMEDSPPASTKMDPKLSSTHENAPTESKPIETKQDKA